MKKCCFVAFWIWIGCLPLFSENNIAIMYNSESESIKKLISDLKEALAKEDLIETPVLTSQSEESTVKRIKEIHCDALLAIGESSTGVVLKTSLPTLMIFNPKMEETLSSNSLPWLYGISIFIDPEYQLGVLSKIFQGGEKIALVYDPENVKSQVEKVIKANESAGLSLEGFSIRGKEDVLPFFNDLCKKGIRAFYLLPDKTIVTPAILPNLFQVSVTNRVPLIGISEAMTKKSALISFHFVNDSFASQIAKSLKSILSKKEGMKHLLYPEAAYSINLKIADIMKIKLSDEVRKNAASSF